MIATLVVPMLVAVATVLITMGLLSGLGFPVHIMSSMIPIFLMPIAVLDDEHLKEVRGEVNSCIGRENHLIFL